MLKLLCKLRQQGSVIIAAKQWDANFFCFFSLLLPKKVEVHNFVQLWIIEYFQVW